MFTWSWLWDPRIVNEVVTASGDSVLAISVIGTHFSEFISDLLLTYGEFSGWGLKQLGNGKWQDN